MIRPLYFCVLATVTLTGCDTVLPPREPEVSRALQEAPPGAAPGSCWGKQVTPAIVETVTDQVLIQPAEVRVDGSVTAQAIYRTVTRQEIVRQRSETWFETPCDDALTPDFIATLQRALAARGHYHGAIDGEMSARTRAAVRAWQAPEGLDSGILSLAAARRLGLVAVERDAG